MNRYVVDGYNVIHAVPELARRLDNSLEAAREQLIQQVKAYTVRKKVHITIVFDGTRPPVGNAPHYDSARLQVVFSRAPFKADPLIKRLISKRAPDGSLTVVTADGDIRRFAGDRQAQVMDPLAFFQRISPSSRSQQEHHTEQKFNGQLSEQELEEWMRLFGEK